MAICPYSARLHPGLSLRSNSPPPRFLNKSALMVDGSSTSLYTFPKSGSKRYSFILLQLVGQQIKICIKDTNPKASSSPVIRLIRSMPSLKNAPNRF
jgi:hypothetical protein